METSVEPTEVDNPKLDQEEHAKHGRLMLHIFGTRSTDQTCMPNWWETTADTQDLLREPSGATPLTHKRDGNTVTQLARELEVTQLKFNCTELLKAQHMATNTRLHGLSTEEDSSILTKV